MHIYTYTQIKCVIRRQKKAWHREFPGGPSTWCFHWFDPWPGN